MALIKRFCVNKNYNFHFSVNHSCLFIKHVLGINYVFLPSHFLWKISQASYMFLFTKKNLYKHFITHFINSLKLYLIYSVKIRIRGLGYRLRSICDTCHYFFFNYTIFFSP